MTRPPLAPPSEASKGPGKAGDLGQGVEMAKGKEAAQSRTRPEDKGKGKEAKTLPKTKALEADQGKDVVPKTKEFKPIKPQAVAQEKKATSGKAVDLA